MKLETRLASLEAKNPDKLPVTLVMYQIVSPSPNGPVREGAKVALILRSPPEDSLRLERSEAESEPGFLDRVAVAHEEIHGCRPEGKSRNNDNPAM